MVSILVVDDDPSIREMLARALNSLGEIVGAAGGQEAIDLLGSRPFDAVLLDWHMPTVDGPQVLSAMKNSRSPHAPVFVITADATGRAHAEAFHGGAVYFLNKPLPLITLKTLVQSALKKGASGKSEPPRLVPNKR